MLVWRSRRTRIAALLVAAGIGYSGLAQAGDSVRAHEAYDRGTAAFQRGEFALAAREFATADALVPSAIALHAALDAAIRADDPVLGVELLDRVARAPADPALEMTARDARARFARRTGRVKIACAAAAPCRATVDGVAVDAAASVILRVGPHSASIESEGRAERRDLEVRPDETITIAPTPAGAPPSPPPSPTPPTPEISGGLSPVWFFFGAGVTALVGGVNAASGIDTANKHSAFVQNHCDGAGAASSCKGDATAGSNAQTRTNVLLGVTAALGVTTAAIGIFVVRWRRDRAVSVGVFERAPGVSLRLSF